MQQFQMNTHLL